jgi:hypothetical protein
MMLVAIIWALILLPQALSVAKINNRVLSLVFPNRFSLLCFRSTRFISWFTIA